MSWSCSGLEGAAGLSFSPQMTVLQQLSFIRYLPCSGKSRAYIGIKKALCCLLCHFSHVWKNTLCWEADGVGDTKIIIQLPTHGQVCSQLLSAPCQALAISTWEMAFWLGGMKLCPWSLCWRGSLTMRSDGHRQADTCSRALCGTATWREKALCRHLVTCVLSSE